MCAKFGNLGGADPIGLLRRSVHGATIVAVMARPHPVLIDIAAGRPTRPVDDHAALLDSAREHRMDGLVWAAVQDGALELPERLERALALQQLRIRRHHAQLWATLEELIETLDQHGLRTATFKGVTAEARWYGDMGRRPSHDLDLVVDPGALRDIDKVVGLIQPDHRLRPHLGSVVVGTGLQAIDLHGPHNTALDLHFDALKLGIPIHQSALIWSRMESFESPAARPVRVFDPETSFILHLFHALKDRFSYLISLVDVMRIVEGEDLDWQYIERFLEREGLEEPAWLSLRTIYDLLGLDTPRHRVPSGWRARAWGKIWPEEICLNGQTGRIQHHRRQMLVPALGRGRLRDTMASARFVILPPPPMLDYYHPDTSGPYAWRLAVGRWRRARERRDDVGSAQ
jgi:hypothetical protein